MAAATDEQIQKFADSRVRPRSEQIRALLLGLEDEKAAIDDIYEALTTTSTWTDGRGDQPPHLLTKDDILAWNTFISNIIDAMRGNAQLGVVLSACIKPVSPAA